MMVSQPTTKSLFDNKEVWRSEPLRAFEAFVLAPRFIELGRRPTKTDDEGNKVAAPPIRRGSARIYIWM